MAKFNGTKKVTPTGKNMAGGLSYDRTVKKEIASVILNSMLTGKDAYYESEDDRLKRIERLITDNTSDCADFIARAMVYVRNEGKLRSISHFMATLLSENVKGKDFLKPAFIKTLLRPDDMTEIVALWNVRNKGKMLPNSLRRAFRVALETKFDEYQFRKYAQLKSSIKLKDVVKMVHPSPKNFEDKTIFKRVIEDRLKNIETAQTINASTTGKERVDAYMDQIKSGKMGYMAAIKNIRTMLENGISIDDLKIWSNMITDPKRVKKSMLLPFRFVDAWKSVKDLLVPEKQKTTKIKTAMQQELEKVFGDSNEKAYEAATSINAKLFIVKRALERAFGLSAGNTNILEEGEKIALLVDESGSMSGASYYKQEESKSDPFFIAKVLSAAVKMNIPKADCFFYTWADHCTERDITDESPFDFIEKLRTRGGGTDVAAPLRKLLADKKYVDKVIIFTDMQMYSYGGGLGTEIKNYIKKYRKMVNPNVKVLFWNLEGYGAQNSNSGGAPIDFESTTDIFEVAGYSDAMLQIIPKLWTDKDYLIKAIEAIEL